MVEQQTTDNNLNTSDNKANKANSEDKREYIDRSPKNFGQDQEEESTPGKTVIEQAREEREKLEKAREKIKKENDRAEELMVRQEMAGKSKGSSVREPTELEKYEERAKERYKGTGLDPSKGYRRQFE